MSVLKLAFCFCLLSLTFCACSRLKSQPVSDDDAKTIAAGKAHSSLQAKASVADLCVKCLLQVIQASQSYHENTASVLPQNITYSVNRVKVTTPAALSTSGNTSYGLEVDVRENESGEEQKLCSYLYNNQSGTVRLLTRDTKHREEISNIPAVTLKKIRSNCF